MLGNVPLGQVPTFRPIARERKPAAQCDGRPAVLSGRSVLFHGTTICSTDPWVHCPGISHTHSRSGNRSDSRYSVRQLIVSSSSGIVRALLPATTPIPCRHDLGVPAGREGRQRHLHASQHAHQVRRRPAEDGLPGRRGAAGAVPRAAVYAGTGEGGGPPGDHGQREATRVTNSSRPVSMW